MNISTMHSIHNTLDSTFKNFLITAISQKKTNSHGSCRSKKNYGFLSAVKINAEEELITLMIFIPCIKDVISYEWRKDGEKQVETPKGLLLSESLNFLTTALDKNSSNLISPAKTKEYGCKGWNGLYLRRLSKGFGKKSIETFQQAFNGTIPNSFSDFCLNDAKINLVQYGLNPFEFNALSLQEIKNLYF